MKKLIVGIASYDEMKARSLAIAKGDYLPKRGEPKVWFTSLESFAKVLSKRNVELLQIIAELSVFKQMGQICCQVKRVFCSSFSYYAARR